MKTRFFLTVLILIAFSFGTMLVACSDDDDDDDDNDDAVGDDDTDEEPCLTEAKEAAEAYCESVGLEYDPSSIGLGTSIAECQVYCGSNDFYLDFDCLDGVCICCM